MAQRTAALPADVMDIMTAFGIKFLAGPNSFDECLYEIAGRITDATNTKPECNKTYMISFRSALRGVAAGMAIGKHIERQRLRQAAEQASTV